MPVESPPAEPTDEEFFDKLLSERGEKWLTEAMAKLGLKPPQSSPSQEPGSSPKNPVDGLADFFRNELKESKAEIKALREALEARNEILTPEQRTLLRPLKSEGADGPLSQPPKKPTEPLENPPQKRGFQRL